MSRVTTAWQKCARGTRQCKCNSCRQNARQPLGGTPNGMKSKEHLAQCTRKRAARKANVSPIAYPSVMFVEDILDGPRKGRSHKSALAVKPKPPNPCSISLAVFLGHSRLRGNTTVMLVESVHRPIHSTLRPPLCFDHLRKGSPGPPGRDTPTPDASGHGSRRLGLPGRLHRGVALPHISRPFLTLQADSPLSSGA